MNILRQQEQNIWETQKNFYIFRHLCGTLFESEQTVQLYTREWVMYNKTPAQAFTPPAEKKMGKKWTFMHNCTGRGKHEVANFLNSYDFLNISCN